MFHQRSLTPGAEYHVWIEPASYLEIFVDFPDNIAMKFSEDGVNGVKRECLDAVEAILARRWRRSRGKRKNASTTSRGKPSGGKGRQGVRPKSSPGSP